ncbi:uncharacterized protein BXZ73DRAFT_77212 [Epithele typhae]|uniref:uncharacterized protein n=1 Tax=Epithele typhae TaxID=378194 RepID=UPI0020074848|nr:uncharacterized protein BXZ73DRAFT_77212 [Epithele typhae]KAH9933587.1 hypothetical protein BXZ73DRAFT_77212 [Epithele typhae]
MASERLPIEVAEQVIDTLGAETDLATIRGRSALTTLTSCALVHTKWLPRSRIHIWRMVKVSDLKELHSICETLQRLPELCLWVRTVRLRLSKEKSAPWVAPVVLLPYLAHINTWEIESCRSAFPPSLLACFRQYTAVKTLVVVDSEFPTPLHAYRLAHAFPALQSLELFRVYCKAPSPDQALISIRTRGRLSHLKLDGGYQPGFRPINWSTLTHLELSLKWLIVEGLTLEDCTSLERLSVEVAESDESEVFSKPAWLQRMNTLMDPGLPESLQALEITLDASMAHIIGSEGSSDQLTALHDFTQLVKDHRFLGTKGVKIIVRDSMRNFVNLWRYAIVQPSLNPSKFTEGCFPELFGHSTKVEHLTISRDGRWAASMGAPKKERQSINIWDIRAGGQLTLQHLFCTLPQGGLDTRLDFSPSNTRLFARFCNLIATFYLPPIDKKGDSGSDSERPQQTGIIEPFEGEAIIASGWSPDSSRIIALMSSMTLHVWDAEGSTRLGLVVLPPALYSIYQFVHMSIISDYALIHLWHQVLVIDLVSGKMNILDNLLNPDDAKESLLQVVLRCGSERGEFTVIAMTNRDTLVAYSVEEDARSSATAPPALLPLQRGLTPKILSADGTRALCFVDTPGPSDTPTAAPWLCVVDSATGEILSGPFGGERPSEIFCELPGAAIERPDYPPYRGGWFWSTRHGKLYRTPALDNEEDVRQVAVTYDGSMVVWSDSRGVVRFCRNDATLIPGRFRKSEGASVKLGNSDEGTSTRGKDVRRRRGGGRGRDARTRKRGK